MVFPQIIFHLSISIDSVSFLYLIDNSFHSSIWSMYFAIIEYEKERNKQCQNRIQHQLTQSSNLSNTTYNIVEFMNYSSKRLTFNIIWYRLCHRPSMWRGDLFSRPFHFTRWHFFYWIYFSQLIYSTNEINRNQVDIDWFIGIRPIK